MKTLMLRQVRLLAKPALASVALGLLTLAGLSLTDGWQLLVSSPSYIALTLVALVAPWLIAVAAIAPDAESGGLAFLGGLPLGRARHLAARTAVAVGWSVAAVLPFLLLATPDLHRVRDETLLATLSLSALAFIAGLAASAVARQSLAAVVAAPLLVAAPLTLYGWFAAEIGAPGEFVIVAPFVVAAVLVVAGWLGFRDPAGTSWRPLVRTAGLLLGAVVLGCGATTAAWARAVTFPRSVVQWSIQGDVAVRYTMEAPDWPGGARLGDWRTTLYPASDLERAAKLDDLDAGAGWAFSEHLRVIESAPDGRALALTASSDELLLLDVTDRVVLARTDRWGVSWPFKGGLDRPGDAWFVSAEGAVRRTCGQVLYQLPAGARLTSKGGDRLVVAKVDGGRVLVDLASGVETPLALTDEGCALSPDGRHLARFDHESVTITSRHRDRGPETEAVFPLERLGKGWLRGVSFAPDDRTAIVEWASHRHHLESRLIALDLAAGTSVHLPTTAGSSVAWSPSGRRLLLHDGWVDLEDPSTLRPLPPLMGVVRRFVDEDTVLLSDEAGRLLRVRLGR